MIGAATKVIGVHQSIEYHCAQWRTQLIGGEKMIGLPALIKYPFYEEATETQLFPFRTMSMILSMISLLGVSHLTW